MMLSEMRSRGLTVKSVQEFNRRVILRLILKKNYALEPRLLRAQV